MPSPGPAVRVHRTPAYMFTFQKEVYIPGQGHVNLNSWGGEGTMETGD